MQVESLKLFCDIARYRSFSRAAGANRISQSAASQMALQLEKHLGVQLIDRTTRPLQLTALGQLYYEGCQSLVEQYLALEASIRRERSERAATVHGAAIYSVGLGDMGQYIERFEADHPGVKVHMEYLHPERVYEKVLAGTVDFGLVSFPRTHRKLEAIPWREEPMVLAVAPTHPLARLRGVRPAQLESCKYIAFDQGLPIRREVDRFLREHGVLVEVALQFDNIENIKHAVEVSGGVALLPEPMLRREVESGTLVALRLLEAQLHRPLAIIRRRLHRLSDSAQAFLKLLSGPLPTTADATPRDPSRSSTRTGQKSARTMGKRTKSPSAVLSSPAHRGRNGTTSTLT